MDKFFFYFVVSTELKEISQVNDILMRRFYAFFLWFLMLALPLQGFAAASMQHCRQDAQPASTQTLPAPHAQHHAAQAPSDVDAMHDQMQQHSSVEQSTDQHNPFPNAAHTCAACATCCNLMAMATQPQLVAAHAAPIAQYFEPLAARSSIPSGLPEKPPRG